MPPAGTEGASATCFAQEPSVLIGVWVCPTCPCGRVAHANEWVQGGERPRLPAAAPVPDTPRPCGLRVVPTSRSSISSLSSPPLLCWRGGAASPWHYVSRGIGRACVTVSCLCGGNGVGGSAAAPLRSCFHFHPPVSMVTAVWWKASESFHVCGDECCGGRKKQNRREEKAFEEQESETRFVTTRPPELQCHQRQHRSAPQGHPPLPLPSHWVPCGEGAAGSSRVSQPGAGT